MITLPAGIWPAVMVCQAHPLDVPANPGSRFAKGWEDCAVVLDAVVQAQADAKAAREAHNAQIVHDAAKAIKDQER